MVALTSYERRLNILNYVGNCLHQRRLWMRPPTVQVHTSAVPNRGGKLAVKRHPKKVLPDCRFVLRSIVAHNYLRVD